MCYFSVSNESVSYHSFLLFLSGEQHNLKEVVFSVIELVKPELAFTQGGSLADKVIHYQFARSHKFDHCRVLATDGAASLQTNLACDNFLQGKIDLGAHI